ncbi:hypothetical protein ACQPZJ_44720 [Actinoplanes sp. CA-054009]
MATTPDPASGVAGMPAQRLTAPATPPQTLVFHRRRRWAVECLAFEVGCAVIFVPVVAVIGGSGLIDYRSYAAMAATAAVIAALVSLPVFVLRLAGAGRLAVGFTGEGVELGPAGAGIAWPQVTAIVTVWGPTGRRVVLTRRDAAPVIVYAPHGSAWLPDRRFRRELAQLRHAAAHNAPGIEQHSGHRRRALAVTVAGVAALLAAVVVRAVDRGVIWPWTPVAAEVAAACPALHGAGLDQFWPVGARVLDRDERDRNDVGDYSYCGWSRRPGQPDESPFLHLSAVVKRHTGFARSSPIAMAARSYTAERGTHTSPLPGAGEQAFIRSTGDEVEVGARRANVTVVIHLDLSSRYPDPAEAGSQAEDAARTLTAVILARISLTGIARPA